MEMYVFYTEAGFHPEMETRGDIRAMIGIKRNHEKKRWIKKEQATRDWSYPQRSRQIAADR